MDKIIQLFNIFGCTMDALIKGEVDVDKADIRRRHERHYSRFARGIALGVSLILSGIAFTTLLYDLVSWSNFFEGLSIIVMFIFIGIAVAFFVVCGFEHIDFIRKYKNIPEIYTRNETERYNMHIFPILIATGVMLIFAGVISSIALSTINLDNLGSLVMLLLIGIGVGLIVYAKITHDKYDIEKYNRKCDD